MVYEPDHYITDLNGDYIYHSDTYFMATELALNMTDLALSLGRDVCYCDVLPHVGSVVRLIELAKFHGADCEIITLDKERGSVHNVPRFVTEAMRESFVDHEQLMLFLEAKR